jgi:hypothetical protein
MLAPPGGRNSNPAAGTGPPVITQGDSHGLAHTVISRAEEKSHR